jgi:stringent starvation protein B
MAFTPGDAQGTSTRPYLLRALHDWCTDNGFTPYIAVYVDGSVQVPSEYVKNNEIVLNVGFEATSGLQLGNDVIEFKARFGGRPRDIRVPVDHVVAIYARENGQGMAFPVPAQAAGAGAPPSERAASPGLRLAGGAEAAPADLVDRTEAAADAHSEAGADAEAATDDARSPPTDPDTPPTPPTRPTLKRVK